MADLPDPRTDAAAFWEALSDEEVFYLLQQAPRVAVWRRTKLGTVTCDMASGVTRAAGGVNPPNVTNDLKARGVRVSNTKDDPLPWRNG